MLNELDHARILGMLQNQQHHEAAEILSPASELGKGAATVEITDAEISPAEDPFRTKFIRLRFRVKIVLPDGK